MTAAGGEVLTPRASKELTGQCFLVEGLRSEIQAVRPRDRPCLWVHTDSGEEGRIPQWLENPRQSFCRESDVAHRSIIEQKPQHVLTQNSDADHHRKVVVVHHQIPTRAPLSTQFLPIGGGVPPRSNQCCVVQLDRHDTTGLDRYDSSLTAVAFVVPRQDAPADDSG